MTLSPDGHHDASTASTDNRSVHRRTSTSPDASPNKKQKQTPSSRVFPMKFEYNVKSPDINVAKLHRAVLSALEQANPNDITLLDKTGTTEITSATLPTSETGWTDTFHFSKVVKARSSSAILIIGHSISTSKSFADLRRSVRPTLQKYECFLKYNAWEAHLDSRVIGYLGNLHPTHHNRESVHSSLKFLLKEHMTPDSDMIPPFKVVPTPASLTQAKKRISSRFLGVECKNDDDAQILRKQLLVAYKLVDTPKDPNFGSFIPSTARHADPDNFGLMLRRQNKYLANHRNIPINGLDPHILNFKFPDGDDLEWKIMKSAQVFRFDPVAAKSDIGRYNISTTDEHYLPALRWINSNLSKLIQEIPFEHRGTHSGIINTPEPPRSNHSSTAGSSLTDNDSIKSYMSALTSGLNSISSGDDKPPQVFHRQPYSPTLTFAFDLDDDLPSATAPTSPPPTLAKKSFTSVKTDSSSITMSEFHTAKVELQEQFAKDIQKMKAEITAQLESELKLTVHTSVTAALTNLQATMNTLLTVNNKTLYENMRTERTAFTASITDTVTTQVNSAVSTAVSQALRQFQASQPSNLDEAVPMEAGPGPLPQLLHLPPLPSDPTLTPTEDARRYDDILFGSEPTITTPATTRVVLNNPSGLLRDGSYDHLQEFLLEWLELGVDVIHLSETNTDWRHPQEFKKCVKSLRQVFNKVRCSSSSSRKRYQSPRQPGGTLTIGTDNFVGRISTTGADRDLGRWSFFIASGRNGRSIVFATVYQVCDTPVHAAGPKTALQQQHTLLDEQGRISTTPTGRQKPHPRQALISDLSAQLRQWRTAGFEIILSGDINESLGADPDLFASLTAEFHLTDIYRHLHGMNEPATYNRGHHRLDYILCTPALLPSISSCGILPFNVLSLSDHRSMFVDFDTSLLFGSPPSDLAPARESQFHSRDYANSAVYIDAVHSKCTELDLFSRFSAAADTATPASLETLDTDLGQALQAGLQAIKKRYKTPFSPIMRQTCLLLRFYNLHLHQFKTQHRKHRALRRIRSMLDSPPPAPATQQECHYRLTEVQKSIRTIRRNAAQCRKDFLLHRIDLESGGDLTKADQIRARIQKTEDLRRSCVLIRVILTPSGSSNLTKLLVPIDVPETPKKSKHWRSIDDPALIVSTLQARNQRHFRQASGTPFTTGELSHIPFDASGPVAESILEGTYQSPDPVLQLFLDELKRPPGLPLQDPPDLQSSVISRLSKWKETTSVSPFSKRFLNQYLALIRTIRLPIPTSSSTTPGDAATVATSSAIRSRAQSILHLHVSLLQLSITHQHSYSRWQKVANLMLEKDFGIPKIHRLRIIHLYEADFNLLMGIFFARLLVKHVETTLSFNPGCYGNRAGMSAHEPVLVEELQNSICCLSRTNRLDLDNDATACYDRIPPNLANLVARHHGMPQALCSIHGQTLQTMSYHLLTASGISDLSYSHSTESPVYGTGQGSTYSPAAWLQIVSKLFDAHGRRANGATYSSPDGSIRLFLHMLGFVDDTKNHVNDMTSPHALSADALASKMSHDSQLWADLLHTTGAALELSKMHFYVSIWRFASSGRPYLDPDVQVHLPVKSPDQTTTVVAANKPVSLARRTLGPMKSPNRAQTPQVKTLLTQSTHFVKLVQSSYMSPQDAWTMYFTFYVPKMTYVLNTSFISAKLLDKVQKTATRALLRKSGFNQSTATAVIYGPPSMGGVGFRRLFTEQSIRQASMLLKNLRVPGQAQSLLQIALSWAQLASGIGTPLLEAPDIEVPTLEDPYIISIRAGLTHLGATLRLKETYIRPLARAGDFYIMEAIIATGKFTKASLNRINYCRDFVRVYLASDAVLPNGSQLDPHVFHGRRIQCCGQPGVRHPRQSRPDHTSWTLWRRALRLIFTTPCSRDLHLLHPLGPWFPLSASSTQWRAYKSPEGLIIRNRAGSLRLYQSTQYSRRQLLFSKSSSSALSTLPASSSPIEFPAETQHYWQVQHIPYTTTILPPVLACDPPTRQPNFFHTLNPSYQNLVSNFTLLTPLSEIAALLVQHPTITVVGDGGAKTCRASFGAVIAVGSIRVCNLHGPVDGPDPRSFRAESYALAAAVIGLSSLLDTIAVVRPFRPSIHLFSDNQGLISTASDMLTWHEVYPSTALQSEWDILSVLHTFVPLLPVTPTYHHVKGHQDRTRPRHTLPLPAQLNCEADDLASATLAAITTPQPTVPVFPSAVCQLDLGDATITRYHHTALRRSASKPALEQYLLQRNQWTWNQYSDISWEAFNLARHVSPNPRFIPKFCHRHLPVGVHAHRNSAKYSPSCPSCPCLQETDEHFLLCSGPTRLKWRSRFQHALRTELLCLQTHLPYLQFILQTVHRLFSGQIVLPHPQFSDLIKRQQSIGWMAIFRGHWSKAWLTMHQHSVTAYPHPDPAQQSRRIKYQDIWLNSLAKFMMRQMISLWTVRNTDRHGSTASTRATRLRQTVEADLAILYTLRPQCEPRHRHLFYPTVELHKLQPLESIQNWISLNRTIISISCKNHKDALGRHGLGT